LRLSGARSLCICLLICGLLLGCERKQESASEPNIQESKELLWSFMTSDSVSQPVIKKWTKSEIRGLMIVDEENIAFYKQFSPLIHQIGQEIGVNIELCEAAMSALASSSYDCREAGLDFYLVVANGNWTDSQWDQVQHSLGGRAADLFSNLRRDVDAGQSTEEPVCRYALATNNTQVPGQIENAFAIIDSSQPIVFGKCGAYLFLNMLGLNPFDGRQPLNLSKEADSVAEFLLKPTPYGATFLLKLLYSPTVKPGMNKTEFVESLPN
jgi:hypothetical protein